MADWSGLTQRLESSGAGRLELPFAEIERLIGGRLPPSSQYPAFWSNSSSYAKAWKRAGYESTRRDVPTGHMGFVRTRTLTAASAAAGPTPGPGQSGRATGEVVLVGCVKTKAQRASAARDLYVSPLFERRRRYAESSGQPWYILSAEHGLLDPGSIIEPYDVYLADQTADYRQAWGEWVAAKLTRVRGSIDGLVIEVHAGMAYVDAIQEPLHRRGAVLLTPLAGLRRGEQLSWYDGSGEETRAPEQAVRPGAEWRATAPGSGDPRWAARDRVVHVPVANGDRGLRLWLGSHRRFRWAAAPGALRPGSAAGLRVAAAAQCDVRR